MFETEKRLGVLTDKKCIRMITWTHLKEINEEQVVSQEYFTVNWVKTIELMMTTTRQSKYGRISILITWGVSWFVRKSWCFITDWCFWNFRDVRLNHYGLDLFFTYTLPILVCDAMLKFTGKSRERKKQQRIHIWKLQRYFGLLYLCWCSVSASSLLIFTTRQSLVVTLWTIEMAAEHIHTYKLVCMLPQLYRYLVTPPESRMTPCYDE